MAAASKEAREGTGTSVSWSVAGMDCASCVAKIEGTVSRLPGVSDIRVSTMTETLSAKVNESLTPLAEIEQRVRGLGYSLARKAAQSGGSGSRAHSHAGHSHGYEGHDHGHDHDDNSDNAYDGARPEVASEVASTAPGSGDAAATERAWWQTAKGQLVLASGGLLAAAWALKLADPGIAYWGFVVATVIGVLPVSRRAFVAARSGMPFTIEMLMTIAATGALFIGAAEEAALVVFLFAVGEVLEGVAANRARASIKALSALVPSTALVEEGGTTRKVSVGALAIGQVVLVRPGDRIPADGEIVEGISGIDESPVTGESIPLTKGPKEAVFAGSINREAVLRIRVDKTAEDNTIARIVRLVEEAQEARAPTERFIDRFSRIYMPVIVCVAVLVTIVPPLFFGEDWQTWIYRGLALLLIGCPCALVISVPASIASALSAGARQGLLMKGGVVIEAAAKTKTVAFDKTGTLTKGTPKVTDVVAYEGGETALLELAAAVETGSNHPLAIAILNKARADGLGVRPAAAVAAIPGKGMTGSLDGRDLFLGTTRFVAERAAISPAAAADVAHLESAGKTVTALVADGRLIGLIALRDEPREDAKTAIAELAALGIHSIMLTGDNARTAAAIAGGLGMDQRAELMPADKVAIVKQLGASGPVMMVGDGINDAPALAAATVSVAMGSGTDVALETADSALMRSRVTDVPQMIRLSRATLANIRQNVAIALGLKAVFLVTTILGFTGLWIAILADTGATVIVTANALRLLGFFRRGSGNSGTPGALPSEPALERAPAAT